MNKYTKLSDFEINKKVADLIGATPYPFGSTEYHRSAVCGMENAIIIKSPQKVGSFDPCNNPADAMPIIIENGIAIRPYKTATPVAFNAEIGEFYGHAVYNENVLRAAMELFLLMKDAENEN
ncbi:phage protein NinX family protein [Providencia rettgeri]